MVQQLVASMAGWKTILQSGLPCLLILFWGSWSDRYDHSRVICCKPNIHVCKPYNVFSHGRRKPCMLIPIFGELITSIGLLLCTYFDQAPVEAAAITETLFTGLTGKFINRYESHIESLYFEHCVYIQRWLVHHADGRL